MKDADYLTLCTYAPAQADFLLNNPEQAAGRIGPHVNANKTESMDFKQK